MSFLPPSPNPALSLSPLPALPLRSHSIVINSFNKHLLSSCCCRLCGRRGFIASIRSTSGLLTNKDWRSWCYKSLRKPFCSGSQLYTGEVETEETMQKPTNQPTNQPHKKPSSQGITASLSGIKQGNIDSHGLTKCLNSALLLSISSIFRVSCLITNVASSNCNHTPTAYRRKWWGYWRYCRLMTDCLDPGLLDRCLHWCQPDQSSPEQLSKMLTITSGKRVPLPKP